MKDARKSSFLSVQPLACQTCWIVLIKVQAQRHLYSFLIKTGEIRRQFVRVWNEKGTGSSNCYHLARLYGAVNLGTTVCNLLVGR